MAKVLVCVAWPYANSPIHLGHVAGSLLPPDLFSRYRRLRGDEVLMVSGSDQHGTPITVRAEKEKVTPLEVAERYHGINKKAIEDLDIEFSLFTKTHTENHIKVVSDVFLDLLQKGHLYEKSTLQYYCPSCEKFLPDRYVEGTCPACGNEKARGDQCEQCGKPFEGGELQGAKCVHCTTVPELRETKHHFIRLSAFQERLIDWVKDKPYWRPSVQLFTQNWLEAGLEDRPITRDMEWGVPVPLPGQEGKVIYVWFDAVIGYLSASMEWAQRSGDPDAWKAYWTDPQVRSYYFLGKDNIPFHTIIWPAILMGRGGLNLPYDVPANEFLTFKGDKVSKSRGTTIDIPSLLKTYEPDIIRYYVAANMPENKDADFSWEDFETKVNNELVATLGNYYHRVLSFTYKHLRRGAGVQGHQRRGGGDDGRHQRGPRRSRRGVGRLPFQEGVEAHHGPGPVRQPPLRFGGAVGADQAGPRAVRLRPVPAPDAGQGTGGAQLPLPAPFVGEGLEVPRAGGHPPTADGRPSGPSFRGTRS